MQYYGSASSVQFCATDLRCQEGGIFQHFILASEASENLSLLFSDIFLH